MRFKSKSSLPVFAKVEGQVEGQTVKGMKKAGFLKKPKSGKTSLDPLYDTTDKYRRVIKPMKVEDFFK